MFGVLCGGLVGFVFVWLACLCLVLVDAVVGLVLVVFGVWCLLFYLLGLFFAYALICWVHMGLHCAFVCFVV